MIRAVALNTFRRGPHSQGGGHCYNSLSDYNSNEGVYHGLARISGE